MESMTHQPLDRERLSAFLSVLWIDDKTQRDDAVVRLLESEGFRIHIEAEGLRGMSVALTHTFDAILLDLRLDDVYGLTVLRRLKAAGMAAPVIVVTGHYGEGEMEAEALQGGAATFLRKPLFFESVVTALVRCIAMRRSCSSAAAGLLLSTHRRVSEIARDVGMDPVYLEKAFHQRFGASPRMYRARHRDSASSCTADFAAGTPLSPFRDLMVRTNQRD